MKLNNQQINTIKEYIDIHLNYVDLKIEVLDHMILDTEVFMRTKNLSFDESFTLTKFKWNKALRSTKSFFYFGSMFSAPRIVLNKAIKSWKLYFFSYLLIYFTPIVLRKILSEVDTEFTTIFNNIMYTLIWIAFIIFNSVWFITVLSKIKTSFSFIIKTLVFMNAFYLFSFFKVSLFSSDGNLNFAFMSFALAGIYMAFVSVIFYRKHLLCIKSIQKNT